MPRVPLLLFLLAPLCAQIDHEGVQYTLPSSADHDDALREDGRIFGFKLREADGQLEVARVIPLTPAARAGLRAGDRILAVGGEPVASLAAFSDRAARSPGTVVDLRLERDGAALERTVRPWALSGLSIRTTGSFRLAVVPVAFPDRAPHAAQTREALDAQFFSRGEYREDPYGKRAFGSVADYFDENSAGRFHLDGQVFDWVEVPSSWQDNAGASMLGTSFDGYMAEALALLEEREGKDVLARFDAVSFATAGPRGPRGGALWPHASGLLHGRRVLRYYTTAIGDERLETIGVHCHEFGHVLGLLDKYGSAHATGLGVFCSMAVGHRGGGLSGDARPFHLCAYCKLRLGWLEPQLLDPHVPVDRALHAVEGSASQAYLIPKNDAGDEFFLLENRQRVGFDTEFPETGLLIWHVGEPLRQLRSLQFSYSIDLEEAHGRGGPTGSHVELRKVPFPSDGRTAFGPRTVPSSGSLTGSKLVSLSGIARVDDAIVFHLGPDVIPDGGEPPPGLADEAKEVARLWLAGVVDSLREQVSLRRVDAPDNEGLQELEAELRQVAKKLAGGEPVDAEETGRALLEALRKLLEEG